MDQLDAKPEDSAKKPQTAEEIATLWRARIDAAISREDKWRTRGRKITRIYRAQGTSNQGDDSDSAKFNIFWSNVETLGPATYSRRPQVEVYRRFHDQDPVARVAGLILERAIQYEIDCRQDFHETVRAAVKDRLLPGRGVCWVRYEPAFSTENKLLPNPQDPNAEPTVQPVETLADEFTPVDYVYWEDVIVSPARTWTDSRWVGRRLLFARDALIKRFGESHKRLGGDINEVPCNQEPDSSETPEKKETNSVTKDSRAEVYEIWDKESKQLIWLATGATVPLDVKADQAKLEDFFPMPRPLLATTTNDEFLPVPDYIYYQEQIRELDSVTRRIGALVGALRLIGVYDATQTALGTLLSGGMENKMVPVNNWAAFAEKGGLKGSMDWVPLEQVVKILDGLYTAREQLKQSVYEITGMADIVRGASMASETLGAQQIKAKFANLRLSSRQQQVAEFVTGILRLKAEIMCSQYAPETLLRISSAEQIPDIQDDLRRMAEQQAQAAQAPMQQWQQAAEQAQQQGMPPPPQPPQQPPAPPPTIEQSQLAQQALQLLKSEKTRNYRIEVASDSMIELDEAEQEQRREKFMSSVSNFFNAIKNVASMAPEMMPLALEMLKFVVRGYKVGRSLESAIEEAVDKMKKRMAAPPPPPQPEPAVQVAQINKDRDIQVANINNASKERIAGLEQQYTQLVDQQRAQQEQLVAAQQQQREDMIAARDQHREDMKMQFDQFQQQNEARLQEMAQSHEQAMAQAAQAGDSKIEQLAEGQGQILDQIGELLKQATRLRKRTPLYDENGDIKEVHESFID